MKIQVVRKILEANEQMSSDLQTIFASHSILALNLMSSPGAGKTALLERTLADLRGELTMAVLEGDIQTTNDAERIAATGAQTLQINTDGACHLDSSMVLEAVKRTDLDRLDILFIENVGNLVCPAAFNLGEDCKIALLSVPEGDDKPEKYPTMFEQAKVLLVNKIDLLPYLDFDTARVRSSLGRINRDLEVFELSARTGEGMQAWYDWLRSGVARKKSAPQPEA
jgi:hydrogenase nickel incorporation protein HypB